jgi:phosphoglycolate phosphatase-like HAD superfamily hydrolase
VVLVSYGYNHGEPAAAAGPDAVVDRLDALPALLARPGGDAGATSTAGRAS